MNLKFFTSQFIESIDFKNQLERKDYYTSIIKKIIFEDLPTVVKLDYPSVLFQLVRYIAQQPGEVINNIHLSQDLNISNKTLSFYLFYLEEVFLIKRFYNFSRNLISSEKRLKKYYLASPSFSYALVDFIDKGKLFENYFASLTQTGHFYHDQYNHEIDFVKLESNNSIIPCELKATEKIKDYDLRSLKIFMRRFKVKKGNSLLFWR